MGDSVATSPLSLSLSGVYDLGLSLKHFLSAVHQWGTEEVAAWLELICLTEYKEIFIGHDVRGAELLHLERRDLKVELTPTCWASLGEGLLTALGLRDLECVRVCACACARAK